MTSTAFGMRCPECSRERTKVRHLRSTSSIPRVTYALIVINVAVFLAEQGQFSLTGSAGGRVVTEGWLAREDIHLHHEYWRLISSAFLHASILHVGFNMYLLYLLGMMLERSIGSIRFA